ncbi:hypothetical protein JB92DRAFT_381245 [Gautieria morchelliformis]|nr:hypothetical protein JB92DRAFT_381245 [Gautieria morchelliformis]
MTQLARTSVEDVQTELLIQTFADRILLLITQVGKVGNLICRMGFGNHLLTHCLDSSFYPAYRAASSGHHQSKSLHEFLFALISLALLGL